MSHYHIWTVGCQMNQADSNSAEALLQQLGFRPALRLELADLIILNSCVVRASAENKVRGKIQALKALKTAISIKPDNAEYKRTLQHFLSTRYKKGDRTGQTR